MSPTLLSSLRFPAPPRAYCAMGGGNGPRATCKMDPVGGQDAHVPVCGAGAFLAGNGGVPVAGPPRGGWWRCRGLARRNRRRLVGSVPRWRSPAPDPAPSSRGVITGTVRSTAEVAICPPGSPGWKSALGAAGAHYFGCQGT
jgi:hypothetical protein